MISDCNEARRAELRRPGSRGHGAALELHLEVLIVAVLADDRLDEVANRVHGRTVPDAHGRRMVGGLGVNRQVEAFGQASVQRCSLRLLERLRVRDAMYHAHVHSDPPPAVRTTDGFASAGAVSIYHVRLGSPGAVGCVMVGGAPVTLCTCAPARPYRGAPSPVRMRDWRPGGSRGCVGPRVGPVGPSLPPPPRKPIG